MWPFRSTRDRIDELRKQREARAPSGLWPWSPQLREVAETFEIRACADFSRRVVVLDIGDIAKLHTGIEAAKTLCRNIGLAIEALERANDGVHITADVEKEA